MKKLILYSVLALSLSTFINCTKESADPCLSIFLETYKMKPYQGEQLTDCTSYMTLNVWKNKTYYYTNHPCADYWPPIVLSCETSHLNWTDELYDKFGRESVFIKVVGIQKK